MLSCSSLAIKVVGLTSHTLPSSSIAYVIGREVLSDVESSPLGTRDLAIL